MLQYLLDTAASFLSSSTTFMVTLMASAPKPTLAPSSSCAPTPTPPTAAPAGSVPVATAPNLEHPARPIAHDYIQWLKKELQDIDLFTHKLMLPPLLGDGYHSPPVSHVQPVSILQYYDPIWSRFLENVQTARRKLLEVWREFALAESGVILENRKVNPTTMTTSTTAAAGTFASG